MASGAQLAPLAQQLAQQIAAGAAPMPTTTEGWQNLVAQFSAKGEPLDLPAGTPTLASALSAPGGKATNASLASVGASLAAQAGQAGQVGQGAASQATGLGSDAVDQFLAAVKQHESGGDYTAYNAGGGASGAYQYIQSTWSGAAQDAGYGQYAGGPASAAPPAVQDAVARHMALSYFNQYGSWKNAAEAWYMPSMAGNPADQNVVPYPSAGNTETVGSYGDQIVSAMGGQPANNGANLPPADNMGSGSAVSYAQSQIGTPYAWGGEQAGVGFDCSGLVQAAFNHAGISLPRTAQAQYDATTKVPGDQQLQPGDLVFFGQSTTAISHVGIYVGNGKMIDAPDTGSVVRTENYNWADYLGATRPGDATGLSTLPTTSAPGSNAPTRGAVLGNYMQIFGQVQSALNSMGAPK